MPPNRLTGYRYRALLLAQFLLLFVYPTLRQPAGSPLLARTLLTIVFLAGGWVVFADRRLRMLGVVLGTPALLGAWTGYALPAEHGPTVAAAFHFSAAFFMGFVIVVLLRGVYRGRAVSADVVAAALCGYLLLGVAFSHIYSLLDAVTAGSFTGLTAGTSEFQTYFQFTYFSFVTMTTVGYGDITPAGETARALALTEAVIGQFYLAVLVADLVGMRVAQALAPEPGTGDHHEPQAPARNS